MREVKRVLFVMPSLPGRFGFPTGPYPGTGYVAEYISRNGIEYDVIDMSLGYSFRDLKRKIEKFKPGLVGLTVFSFRRDKAYEVVKFVKSFGLKIVIGGPHATTFRTKVVQECDADFVVKGEGEHTLLELCQGKPLKDIKGLIFRNGNKITENEDRPWNFKLDEFPWPRYEKFELSKYLRNEIYIVTSRGCPFRCCFCPIPLLAGRNWRGRSPENVFEEIKYWYEKDYRTFKVYDDCVNLDRNRIIKICNLIIKNNMKITIECASGMRADLSDRELLKKMKEAGWSILGFGVESANNDILQAIKKEETIEQIEKAVKNAVEIGFNVELFFMVGNPLETPEHIKKSIKFALKYPVRSANFFSVVPCPGTELFDFVNENNHWVTNPKTYLNERTYFDEPIFETPEFPLEERKRMRENVLKVERFIRKRYMKIKFKKAGFLNGIFGSIAADIVYSDFTFKKIVRLQAESKWFKKFLIFLAKNLDLDYTP